MNWGRQNWGLPQFRHICWTPSKKDNLFLPISFVFLLCCNFAKFCNFAHASICFFFFIFLEAGFYRLSTFQLLNAKINNKQYISEHTYIHRYLYVCIWSRSLRKAVRAFTYSQWVMELWFTTRGLRRRLSILTSFLFVSLACLAFVEQGRNAHLADLVFPAFTAFRSTHTSQYHMWSVVK